MSDDKIVYENQYGRFSNPSDGTQTPPDGQNNSTRTDAMDAADPSFEGSFAEADNGELPKPTARNISARTEAELDRAPVVLEEEVVQSETSVDELLRVAQESFEKAPVKDGYEDFRRILGAALDQSMSGKGRARHGMGKAFKDQPINVLSRMLDTLPAYQIMKKTQEANRMAERGRYEQAIAEFYGVIVYAVSAILLVEERMVAVDGEPDDGEAYTNFG